MCLCVFPSTILSLLCPLFLLGRALTPKQNVFGKSIRSKSVRGKKRSQKRSLKLKKKKKQAAPGASFVLHSIPIIGTSVFSAKDLSFIWTPYLNKKVNFNDLNNIVKLIKRVYKDLGYLTTTAFLPPQDIKDGQVLIHVVEGKRGNWTSRGTGILAPHR